MIPSFHLPKQVEYSPEELIPISGSRLTSPALSREKILGIVEILRDNRKKLAARPVMEILKVIGSAAARWNDPAYELRRLAEEYAPSHSRFSKEMFCEGIRLILKNLSEEYLLENLISEIGEYRSLDAFTESGGARLKVVGPEITSLMCAGNIPGVSLISLAHALLLKSSALVRVSASDALFPALFARSINDLDEEIGDCLAVMWWDRADSALMESALKHSDAIIAYGSDETLDSLREKTDKPFLGYGHKVSFSFVAKEKLNLFDTVPQAVARDVSLFDQQGCLSPHVVYVEEGGMESPDAFAGRLARAMDEFAALYPIGALAPGEAGQIMQIRGAAEFRQIAGKEVKMWSSGAGIGWTVIYENDPAFVLSCLNRTIWVKPIASIEILKTALFPWRRYLQSAGIAAPRERIEEIAEILANAGVNRICPAGTMQEPGPSWRHDGIHSLCRLVRWAGIEGFENE